MDDRTRNLVRTRAQGRCEYCGLPDIADEWPFHVDHIVASVHQMNDRLSNLAWACIQCNLHKGPNISSLDPATLEKVDLFDPRRHEWHEHFSMDQNARIVGTTPIGRATVRLLGMNDTTRLELRRELRAQGLY